jgi:uncharacterized protein (TIGR03086 family)
MLQDLRAATEWTASIVDGVDIARQGDRPTPCTEWDVRVLLVHLVSWNRLFAAGLLGLVAPDAVITAALATSAGATEVVPDIIGSSPGHAYRTSAHEVTAVLSLDRDLAGTCRLPVGELPATTVATTVLAENLVHGWDLAVATGQRATMPDTLVPALHRAAAALPVERTRGSLFGPAVAVLHGANDQDRMLAFLGRNP